jgi:malonyl-CoA O-methyltransferase
VTALAPLEAYRLLAAEYDRALNPVVALERRTLVDALPSLRGKTVIDAAAGTGYWAGLCAERGARALAVDFCWEMLVGRALACAGLEPGWGGSTQAPMSGAEAPRKLKLALHRLAGDLRALPFANGCGDLTICAFGVGYAPGCMTELRRVTRRGGTVIVSDVHPDAIGRGWTRSFRHHGRTIEVEHARYKIDDLTVPGLRLDELREPCFGEPERSIFESAGKAFAADSVPAIFVARWTAV